jgi:hypothetical protein
MVSTQHHLDCVNLQFILNLFELIQMILLINLETVMNPVKRAKETTSPHWSTSQKVHGSNTGGYHTKDAKEGNQNGKILLLSCMSQDSLQRSTSHKVNHSDSVGHHAKDANQEN